MISLYNKYGAWNEIGCEVGDKFGALTDETLKKYPDINLYELQCVILNSIDLPITIERMKKGLRLKEKERKNES